MYEHKRSLLQNLIFRLPPTRPQVEAQLKSIRNRMRRYSARSIAILAYQSLHIDYDDKLNELRAAPWLAILIAKWALQDQRIPLELAPPMPQVEFDKIRQELWELQGNATIAIGATTALLFRNAINVQLDFQRQQPYFFLRWPALVDALPEGHEMRKLFVEALRMLPQAYSDYAFAAFATNLKNKDGAPLAFYAPLAAIHGDAGKNFFALVAHDFASLRVALQSKEASRVSGIFELFQSPYLKRFPLLRQADQTVACWHPMVLARGMEDVVHLQLSSLGERYPQVFSKVFENHVVGQLNEAAVAHIREKELKAAFGRDAPSVEAVIECRDCNVFIEAKMSLFWDEVLVSDGPSNAFDKAKHVRKAILQGLRVGELLRAPGSPFPNCSKKDKDFLVIVTSRELNMGGGKLLERLFPANALANIYPEARTDPVSLLASNFLSPERVFVISIEDYERLIGTLARGRIDLQDLLQHAASSNLDPSTAHMYFHDYLAPFATDGWPKSRLLSDYLDATQQRLERHLLPTPVHS